MSRKRLEVGGVPEHFNLPWHLAIESSNAAVCGLDVHWTDYSAGTGAMLADLASGALDLAVLLTEGAALGLARNLPIAAISLYTNTPLIWGVHVPVASAARSVADLHRARFAISRTGSGSHLMSLAMAIEHGWPPADLKYEIVDDLDGAIGAFQRGRADVFLWEHFTTEPAVAAGHLRRLDDFTAPWPAWTVCANATSWHDHRPAIESLTSVVAAEATRLAAAADAPATIAARYALEPIAVAEWLSRTEWADRPSPPDRALEAATRMLRTAGAIQSRLQ